MLNGIISYELISLFVVTLWIHQGESFFDHVKKHVQGHNENLKNQLTEKKISPRYYMENRLNLEQEKRVCIFVNYIVAPILAPYILITIFMNYTALIIELIKFR